ncbi:hypothetical protein QRX60_44155 [Amycolatopsis mongoliensis]|uniref:Uncharacterized protein n=1 Tax=Amycolatopsis mongoliensis TaxID=715475 RepID=A0A9Y2JNJ3_9PSEU|nr:hypothetical protein [Amycolatopsis sp. 4-36]WIY00970.1 hypothetical protein QRX60_44155 [Amycolatopsis sp. 4-36]
MLQEGPAVLVLPVVFTFVYATAAARLRRAERVLPVTITGFIALFPGSELGLECAAVFAVFTSQAFWRVDVPSGMIPLVWNGMMSFGGGWFFLTASEALSVGNRNHALPGIGAYVAAASADGDLGTRGELPSKDVHRS